jgi:branched-chain amino acid transport system permease protein
MDFGVIFDNSLQALFGVEACYFALAAIGLNIHFGYTGLLNFGQVGFLAVGAYGIGVSVVTLDLPFGVGIVVGLLAAVVLALLLGIPTLRLRADYLAIVTIAASEIIRLTARAGVLSDVAGGSAGLNGFANSFYELNPLSPGTYGLGPIDYNERAAWVLLCGWTMVIVGSFLVFMLMRSPWGRVLRAIREDEDAARSLGKNVYAYKMQALILGGIFGALAGFVFSVATQSIQPDSYGTPTTFFAYTALLIGGAARIFGPVVGSMIFWVLLVFLENVLVQAVSADYIPEVIMDANQVGQVRFILVGIGLMLLMIYRPQGLFGDRKELALDAR